MEDQNIYKNKISYIDLPFHEKLHFYKYNGS
jgi:hypothetical protein